MNELVQRLPIVKGICIQDRKEFNDMGKETGQMIECRCDRIIEQEQTCIAYMDPRVWEVRGGCPLCSIPTEKQDQQAKKVNALKASKRKFRGR